MIVKNVPLDFADKELLPTIRCKRVEKESYETPLRVNKTVFTYDFGVTCSPPKNVIDSLKLQKDFIRDQYSQANQRRVKFEMQEAEKGNPSAQYMLGRRYLYGDGVTKDEKEGRRWLQASAVQGNPDAQTKLQSLASQN